MADTSSLAAAHRACGAGGVGGPASGPLTVAHAAIGGACACANAGAIVSPAAIAALGCAGARRNGAQLADCKRAVLVGGAGKGRTPHAMQADAGADGINEPANAGAGRAGRKWYCAGGDALRTIAFRSARAAPGRSASPGGGASARSRAARTGGALPPRSH